jgi:hypothetical protein
MRRALLLTGLFVMAGPLAAQTQLGLAERRGLATYREQIFPGLLQEIHAAAGFELPVEVMWDTLAVQGQGARYNEPGFFTDIYFRPLILALQQITRDQMGKDALKAGLQRVVVRFDPASAPASNWPNGLSFTGGTLTINFRPWSNTGDIQPRAAAMVQVLERGL